MNSFGDAARELLSPWLEELKQRGIVYDYKFNFDEGDELKKSVDSETMRGLHLRELRDWVNKLRELERQRQFEQ